MAIDTKYGRVTLERGTIGEDEPVVVFRAQDNQLVPLLSHYLEMCAAAGSPGRHLAKIEQAKDAVAEWQASNYTQVPQSREAQ
jgi:hypothetical protein